jgi:hypothetical protein
MRRTLPQARPNKDVCVDNNPVRHSIYGSKNATLKQHGISIQIDGQPATTDSHQPVAVFHEHRADRPVIGLSGRWRSEHTKSAMRGTPVADLKFKLNGRFPKWRTHTPDPGRSYSWFSSAG